MYPGFTLYVLDDGSEFWAGELPNALRVDADGFQALWDEHPPDFHVITMHGRPVRTPRWQQAYGRDYRYTGKINRALPILPALRPLLVWGQKAIDARLNGILVNWYDGRLGHYIGAHRDSTKDLMVGAPIVTVSLGETRRFRLRPWKSRGFCDYQADNGTVFVMPYATNQAWTHEVPRSTRHTGKRISVTLRAFERRDTA